MAERRGIGCGGLVVLGAGMLWVANLCAPGPRGEDPPPRPAQAQAPAAAPRPVAPPPPAPPPAWEYMDEADEMGRGRLQMARMESTSTLELPFPYQGPQRASITIRRHPKYGTDVMLGIQRGQFHCSSLDDCMVTIRFDEEKPSAFSVTRPSDGSSETLFIANAARFIGKVRKAKHVAVEAEFFQAGVRVMRFDVADLVWPPR